MISVCCTFQGNNLLLSAFMFTGALYNNDVENAVRDIQGMLEAKVAPRWYQMGVTLGVPVAHLEAVRLNRNLSVQESERGMLDAWLKNADPERTTWQWLVDAVGHSAGGNYQRLAKTLAKKIAAKLAGKTIYTSLSLQFFVYIVEDVMMPCKECW